VSLAKVGQCSVCLPRMNQKPRDLDTVNKVGEKNREEKKKKGFAGGVEEGCPKKEDRAPREEGGVSPTMGGKSGERQSGVR